MQIHQKLYKMGNVTALWKTNHDWFILARLLPAARSVKYWTHGKGGYKKHKYYSMLGISMVVHFYLLLMPFLSRQMECSKSNIAVSWIIVLAFAIYYNKKYWAINWASILHGDFPPDRVVLAPNLPPWLWVSTFSENKIQQRTKCYCHMFAHQ